MPHKARSETLIYAQKEIYCYTLISTSELKRENERELSEGNHKKGATEK